MHRFWLLHYFLWSLVLCLQQPCPQYLASLRQLLSYNCNGLKIAMSNELWPVLEDAEVDLLRHCRRNAVPHREEQAASICYVVMHVLQTWRNLPDGFGSGGEERVCENHGGEP